MTAMEGPRIKGLHPVTSALCLALLAAAAMVACRGPGDRPPDVLLLTVDTLRADRLGVDGYAPARTPNLDALAARGVYFAQAVTPMPRTTPGLASLLSGLWPQHHGSREVGDPMTAGTTLAQVLAGRGYRTLAVSTNASAGPKQNLAAGFERFVTYEDIVERYGDRLYRDLTDAPPDGVGWAEATTREAVELVRQAAPEEPLFLWVFYFDPHFFYRPPSPWQDGVAADRCWRLYQELAADHPRAGLVFAGRDQEGRRALPHCSALYDAEVAYFDHELGRLIAALRDLGRFDDALVVFTADHGENLGEGGLYYEHGDNVHDASLRVPLIFTGPGIARARVDRGSASLVDVAPTVLSWLGVPAGERPASDGVDLAPRLHRRGPDGRQGTERVVFAESAGAMWNHNFERLTTGRTWGRVCVNGPRYSLCQDLRQEPGVYRLYDHRQDPALTRDLAADHPEEVARLLEAWQRWPPESARLRAARTPRFKLVARPLLAGGYTSALYDLAADPAEVRDVGGEHPEVAARLAAALERWAAGIPEPVPQAPDPELEKVLRSLGYIQ